MTLADDAVAVQPDSSPTVAHEVRRAARNGLMLGTSLVATWSVAMVVRLLLPRHLGPAGFGQFSFADSFAGAGMGLITLGIEAHIQRDVPVHPSRASDYFAGVVLVRAAIGLLVITILQLMLGLSGRPADLQYAVLFFSLGYLIYQVNGAFAALLQANATVRGLAISNVGGKILWGGLLGGCILAGASLPMFALSFAVSEAGRCLVLQHMARRHLDLRFRLDREATSRALVASLPFWATALVLSLSGRLDVTVLSLRTHDEQQVGWYSSSANLAMLTFLLAPLMSSVLLPLLTRAKVVSEEQMWRIVRRVLEGIITIAAPAALFIALGADLWVYLAFGPPFAPAAMSLRVLAPLFLVTYVNSTLSMTLFVRDRGWSLTGISAAGIFLNPVVALFLIPVFAGLLGPGGAGVGSGFGVVVGELLVCTLLILISPRGSLDSAFWGHAGRTILACVITIAVHFGCAPLGHLRLGVDVLTYLAAGMALGAVRPRELYATVRDLLSKAPLVR